MPYTRTDMFLAAKRAMRVHRDWDDEQVADFLGIHHLLIPDVIVPARREIEQDEGQVRDV
jgi:hypothetical protein